MIESTEENSKIESILRQNNFAIGKGNDLIDEL